MARGGACGSWTDRAWLRGQGSHSHGAPLLDRAGDAAAATLCSPEQHAQRIALPSLHLIGRWDVLCRAGSERLAERYEQPTVYTHGHGHALPAGLMADQQAAEAIRAFVARQQAIASLQGAGL